MKTRLGMICWCGLAMLLGVGGCQPSSTPPEGEFLSAFPPAVPIQSFEQELLVGTVGQMLEGQAVQLEGYGLVGGLANTGSTVCPPNVLSLLQRLSQAEVPDRRMNIEGLVRDRSTAVVYLLGTLPPLTRQNDPIDVKVTLLNGSDATSLRGGWLYSTQLWPVGSVGQPTRQAASARGAVYVDRLDGQVGARAGVVLGGASALNDMTFGIRLNKSDYRTSAATRNVIDMRFGHGTAQAQGPQFIALKLPTTYQHQRERFLAVLKQLPLNLDVGYLSQRGEFLVQRLTTVPEDRPALEVALEAMGTAGEARLVPVLNSEDPTLRLIAARCLVNIGSPQGASQGFDQLQQLAGNPQNPDVVRIGAIRALGAVGDSLLAQQALRPLWQDASLDVALTAYEQVAELGGQNLDRVVVAQYIQVDSLNGGPNPAIVAHRSKSPRLALIGGPLGCQGGRAVVWPDRAITLDTQLEPGWVHLGQRGPGMANQGTVRCPNDLKILIQVLCAESHNTLDQPSGLGLTYADLLGFLKFLCDQGVVQAEFWGGPMPE